MRTPTEYAQFLLGRPDAASELTPVLSDAIRCVQAGAALGDISIQAICGQVIDRFIESELDVKHSSQVGLGRLQAMIPRLAGAFPELAVVPLRATTQGALRTACELAFVVSAAHAESDRLPAPNRGEVALPLLWEMTIDSLDTMAEALARNAERQDSTNYAHLCVGAAKRAFDTITTAAKAAGVDPFRRPGAGPLELRLCLQYAVAIGCSAAFTAHAIATHSPPGDDGVSAAANVGNPSATPALPPAYVGRARVALEGLIAWCSAKHCGRRDAGAARAIVEEIQRWRTDGLSLDRFRLAVRQVEELFDMQASPLDLSHPTRSAHRWLLVRSIGGPGRTAFHPTDQFMCVRCGGMRVREARSNPRYESQYRFKRRTSNLLTMFVPFALEPPECVLEAQSPYRAVESIN